MNSVEDALNSSRRAVEFDRGGFRDAASYYYRVAARLLEQAYAELPENSGREAWREKAQEYKERADVIQAQAREETPVEPPPSPSQVRLLRCRFLLSHALDADEAGQKETAVRLYTQAIEMSLAAKGETSDPELQSKLTAMARQALERAEQLKGIKRKLVSVSESTPGVPSSPVSDRPRTEVVSQASSAKPGLHRGSSGHLKVSGKATYTDEEKRVLLATSRINRHDYVPFMTIDLSERFQYAIPFTDPDGPLALSPKQQRDFARWARPEEFCSEPKMVINQHVDYYSIKQTVVSDCSFVASLAVSALYEKRFARRLITSIIYPRNRDKEPVYNPFGKYMVKLHLNGVPRKVIIDDQLPVDKHGRLLCSYSTNRDELWISLLEKAYMKVMGGYDFPGSNSNIDLHALSGWVPERMAIRPGDPQFDSDALFNSLLTRLHKGDVLVTVATGELTDAQADRTGLVPTHAYAVLDIRLVKGVQLLKLKNPWSHVRWRGNYSELDAAHWKAELCRALDYDPGSAAAFDNGIFWIDYASILRFYDVFYLNWNPALFSHTYCIHQSWSAGAGPVKDAYNIGDNPQFRLEASGSAGGAIWILLTRHITQIDDFRENTEYITVLVYCNDGKRVYYPNDPPPYMDGVRINSPHYLCKILLADTPVRRFTLVVSQYEKTRTIHYTLRAYATAPFTLEKITNPYTHSKQVSEEWRGARAGGCRNHPTTYPNNPRYEVTLASPHNNAALLIDLKGPKQYQMGVEVTVISLDDDSITAPFTSKSSGPFRSGFVVLELEDLPGGVYAITPSTYLPGQEGPFFLTVKASCALQLTRIS